MLIVTDPEGVLVPEIREETARVTGLPRLPLTTRDVPDSEAPAHRAILHRGPDALAGRTPGVARASSFEELRQIIIDSHEALTSDNLV